MLELHGWITFRETYKGVEDCQFEQIMKDILRKCESLEYHQLKPRAMDGEWYLETTLFANHHNPEVEELFEFLAYAASRAPGSYGVFYMHDDEDRTGRENEFQVFVIARGKIRREKDPFLSPFIPAVEDAEA